MQGDVNYRQALTKAMTMCSQSERCRFDIAVKLREWGISEEDILNILDYLIRERFLDEGRFVRFYISDKLRFNKWGKIKLTYMLRQKQIPEELIKSGLDQISDELYGKILTDLLKAKIKSIKGDSVYERRGKLSVFAQGHGFEADLAFKIAGQLIGNVPSD